MVGPTLSFCMIVKDEADVLANCLASVQDIVDEMIVVDTGSQDDTPQIAANLGANVFYYQWCGDFGAARNYSIDQARGDWVLILDADEELSERAAKKIPSLIKNERVEGYYLQVINYYGQQQGLNWVRDPVLRLFRNRTEYRFQSSIHEEMGQHIIDKESEAKLKTTELRIYHYGYLDQRIKEKDKINRNIALIEDELEQNPEDPSLFYCLGTEYMQLDKLKEAIDYLNYAYQTADRQSGFFPDLVVKLNNCYLLTGQFNKAKSMLDEVVTICSNLPDYWWQRGRVEKLCGNFKSSLQSFTTGLKLGASLEQTSISGADNFRLLTGIGDLWTDLLEFEQAAYFYQEALNYNSGNTAAWQSWLITIRENYNLKDSPEVLTELIPADSPQSMIGIAYYLVKVAPVEALNYYLTEIDKQITTTGENLAVLKGWQQLYQGHLKQAISYWEEAGVSDLDSELAILKVIVYGNEQEVQDYLKGLKSGDIGSKVTRDELDSMLYWCFFLEVVGREELWQEVFKEYDWGGLTTLGNNKLVEWAFRRQVGSWFYDFLQQVGFDYQQNLSPNKQLNWAQLLKKWDKRAELREFLPDYLAEYPTAAGGWSLLAVDSLLEIKRITANYEFADEPQIMESLLSFIEENV